MELTQDITRKINRMFSLRNARACQTGATASATQRKVEALENELMAAGVTREQFQALEPAREF